MPGAIYGSSDRIGAYPATDPVTPDDIAATMFWALGIDPATEVTDTLGRPLPIAAGKPITRHLWLKKFDSLRVEIAKDLGAINTNLESFKGRAESELGVAKWAARVLTPAVIGLIGFGFGGAWYLAKVDSRLDELVKQTARLEVRRSQPPAPITAPDEPKPIPDTMPPPSKAVLPPTNKPTAPPR